MKPDKSTDAVRAMFDAIAPRYDLLNHLLSFNQDVRWRQRAVRFLSPKANENILDLCCGTGDLSLEILRRQPRCQVTGADFAEPMLALARQKTEDRRQKISFVAADALHLQFTDEAFDAVTVGFGVRNFEDTAAGLREIRRVLRPGGRVMILEFMRPQTFFMRNVYGVFFKGILPKIGTVVSQHNSAYAYLPASVNEFYSRDEFEILLRECGFCGVRSFDFSLGAATCFVARTAA